jgi:hypothetical protein
MNGIVRVFIIYEGEIVREEERGVRGNLVRVYIFSSQQGSRLVELKRTSE